jgi:hypothetical protein
VVQPGRQLRSFDQHVLDVLVALLGNGCAHHFVRFSVGEEESAAFEARSGLRGGRIIGALRCLDRERFLGETQPGELTYSDPEYIDAGGYRGC